MTTVVVNAQTGEITFVEGPEPSPAAYTIEQLESLRASAFREEADPLFFEWQAGEGTQEAWQAKRAEIRARFPYP